MKVHITIERNSGVHVENFKEALEEFMEEWTDDDEPYTVEVTLEGTGQETE